MYMSTATLFSFTPNIRSAPLTSTITGTWASFDDVGKAAASEAVRRSFCSTSFMTISAFVIVRSAAACVSPPLS